MPIITYESLDAVPESLREIAKEVDGKVQVDVVPAAKLKEFRDTNIEVSKERDELKASLKRYVDAIGGEEVELDTFGDSLAELKATAQKVADGDLKESDKIEQEVNRRVTEVKTTYDEELRKASAEIGAWKEKYDATDGLFKNTQVERYISDAALKADSGIEPSALPDILSRGKQIFKLAEDGSFEAKNGETTIYGSDGVTPKTAEEWIKNDLLKEAPHFFKSSKGGSADGGTSSKTGGMSSEDFAKLTPVQRLEIARSETK